uniref:Uncharacterized protein n=1 Tax=Faecalibaculum rodentium TaxID=1702221 RepID=A0A140DXC2_9FIRM|nr:hypothetical protein AALO17_21650 [Faecalibaculum rodentium]
MILWNHKVMAGFRRCRHVSSGAREYEKTAERSAASGKLA